MELFGRELSLEQMVGFVECQATPDEDLVHRAALEIIAALRESRRRADAAVEDAKQGSVCRTCHYLNNGCEPLNLDAGCRKWQWRGPQEAGEGGRDGT